MGGEVEVSDIGVAGLPVPSVVCSAKIATIEARDAARIVTLPESDGQAVAARLRRTFAPGWRDAPCPYGGHGGGCECMVASGIDSALDWRPYRSTSMPMESLMSLLSYLIIVFMIAALAVVVLGVLNMARPGAEGRQRSNKLMQLRVLFQFIAIVLIGVLLLLWSR